jgi:ribosomal protein L37AE/L43A
MSAHSFGETRPVALPLPEAWKSDNRDKMIKVTGSEASFHCEDCGCNVFKEVEPRIYRCNGCGALYEGESQ